MEKGGTVIHAGPIDFAMSYRQEIMDDQGLCLQVYSKINNHDTEILRFDCFDQNPHYHYGPENHNIRLHMDKTTAGNSLGWTLGNVRNKLSTMVERAGYEDLASNLEANPISDATLDELESTARNMALEGPTDGTPHDAGNAQRGQDRGRQLEVRLGVPAPSSDQ